MVESLTECSQLQNSLEHTEAAYPTCPMPHLGPLYYLVSHHYANHWGD